jgi:PAS domain S-box-containing protein
MSAPPPAEAGLQNEIERLRARIAELERERQIPNEIIQKSPMMISIVRAQDLVYEFVNLALQSLAPGKEFLGRRLADVCAEVPEPLVELRRNVLDTGLPYELEDAPFTIQRGPGEPPEVVYISYTFVPLPGPDGKPDRILTLSHDTTASVRQRQQLAESNEALRESEAVLRSLFDSPEVMRGIVELVDGVIVHVSCNQTAAKMFGVDHASVPGKAAIQLGASDEVAQAWVVLYEESRRTGKPVSMEYPRRDAGGRDRWLLATASYLRQGRSGYPRFAYTILDLTDRKHAEEAFHKQRRLLEVTLQSIGDAVLATDAGGKLTFLNRVAAQLTGWTEEQALGQRAQDVLRTIDEQTRAIGEDMVARVWREGRAISMANHTVLVARDGREIPIEDSAAPIRDGAGHVLGVVLVFHDVTEKRRAHQELQNVIDSISDGLLVLDRNWSFTYFSEQGARMIGMRREDLIGGCLWEIFPHAHDTAFFEGYHRAVETGQPVTFEEYYPEPINKWFECHCYPSETGLSVYFHDITARHRTEEALRESELRLRTLSDNLPEGAIYQYSHDVQGQPHVDFISAGIERLTGVPAAEFMADAATVYRNILPEDHDRLSAAIALSREQLTQFEVEVRHPHRITGEIRWSLLRSTPTRNPDGSMVWDGIELDITERKRVEAALREHQAKLAERTIQLERTAAELEERNREVERVNRMKTEFLSRSSHELRTPLNAIVGYSDLLAEQPAGPLPPPYPRFVANIQEGARHLLAMVNDLLDISRIEAGHIDLNRESFHPADALEEVLSVIAPLSKIKDISIENAIPGGMSIRADRTRFKQVLYNLFSNAVKFTPENGRVWIAEASHEDAAGFCVGDTGIGIPESELESVFDEFHQVSGPSDTAREGTGLGLAITRRLVELHGGTIGVESTVGQGSRFIFSLGAHSLLAPEAV